MLPNEVQDLLAKYARGACTPQEEQFIIDWYNNIGDAETDRPGSEKKPELEEKLWAAINPGRELKRTWRPLKRAAMITVPLLLVAFLWHHFQGQSFIPHRYSSQPEFRVSRTFVSRFYNNGKTERNITLPDGSRVVLQPSSEIAISKDFGNDRRDVRLKGEAFFKVERDSRRPFFVYANEVVTRVLGTSFNVRAYENDGDITVAVKTGRVSVYAHKCNDANRHDCNDADKKEFLQAEVILTPNQQIVYHRAKAIVTKQLVEKPEVILPNSNLFRMQFENEEVEEIFNVLEENYGVEISYDKDLLKNCKLTTSMSDEGLYERIEVICKAIGASYSCNDAVITIKSNGC